MRKKIMATDTSFKIHSILNTFRLMDLAKLSKVRVALNTASMDALNVLIAELEPIQSAEGVRSVLIQYRDQYMKPLYHFSGGDVALLKSNAKKVRDSLILICDQCTQELKALSTLTENTPLLSSLIGK